MKLIKLASILTITLLISCQEQPCFDFTKNTITVNGIQIDSTNNTFNKSQALTFSIPNSDLKKHTTEWKFGDGTNGEGSSVQHTYSDTGEFVIQVQIVNRNCENGNIEDIIIE